jgi:Protein of unknown function (DUF1071)
MSLLHVNVNEHTEKKNGLTYLSWAWAWAEVLKADPEATWEAIEYPQPDGTLAPCMYAGNGTAMVKTAIPQPDSFAINTAIMRCMTKAISMHGLGLYIYAGEDLPVPEPVVESVEAKAEREAKEARQAELQELALYLIDCQQQDKQMDAIRLWYAADTWCADPEDANEERLFVWGLLKGESKLRSAIKANKPVDKAEAWKAGAPEKAAA